MDSEEMAVAKGLWMICPGIGGGAQQTRSFLQTMGHAAKRQGYSYFDDENGCSQPCFALLPVLTDKQAHWLMVLAWKYRKQMPAHLVMIASMRLGGNPKCKFEDRGTASLPMMG